MALARTRRDRGVDYWPGFVDALSTLVLVIIFLLSVFVVVHFFLSQEVTGKDTALARLNAQIAQLTEMLSLEKTGKANLEDSLAALRAGLAAAESERDRFKGMYEGIGPGAAAAQGKAEALASDLDSQKQISARALSQVELLNQQIAALRRQLSAIEEALQASEKKDKEAQARIADLGRLRAILGARPDIRVVGDRFVFQSEILFDSGSASLKPEGQSEVDKLAGALIDLEKKIPAELAWVLRIDGHTDVRPISSSQFPSNWELSAARAISVVQFLISRGVPPRRLVAAGFDKFPPFDTDPTEQAFRRHRRIALKLT